MDVNQTLGRRAGKFRATAGARAKAGIYGDPGPLAAAGALEVGKSGPAPAEFAG
jgi:hypothetical protein